jgi:hypothetical protein
MGEIVVMKFAGQRDAGEAMLRLHRRDGGGPSVLSSLSVSLDKAERARVEQIIDPMCPDGHRWSYFWIGLLYAGHAEFLGENFPLELMHSVPALFLDSSWWTQVLNLSCGF